VNTIPLNKTGGFLGYRGPFKCTKIGFRLSTRFSVYADNGHLPVEYRVSALSIARRCCFVESCISLLRKLVVGGELFTGGPDLLCNVRVPAVVEGLNCGFEERRPRAVSTVDRAVVRVTLSRGADTSAGCAHRKRVVVSERSERVGQTLKATLRSLLGLLEGLSIHFRLGAICPLNGGKSGVLGNIWGMGVCADLRKYLNIIGLGVSKWLVLYGLEIRWGLCPV
jgi:hypothetical protein